MGEDLRTKWCPTCGTVYAMTAALDEERRRTGERWFCPNGHPIVYTDSDLSKAKRRVTDLEAALDRAGRRERDLWDKLCNEGRSNAALRGVITRMKRKAGNAV